MTQQRLLAGLVLMGLVGVAAHAHDLGGKLDLRRAMLELQEVTHEYFDHPRSAKVEAFIGQGHAQIRALAQSAPEARRIATVIFRRGMSTQELNDLYGEFRLSMHGAKVVFSMGTERDYSNSVAIQYFHRYQDSATPVLDLFIAQNREGLLMRAAELRKVPGPAAEQMAANFEKVVKQARPVWIRMDVTGKADLLRLLSEEPEVYAVVLDPSEEKVRLLDDIHSKLAAPAIQDITDR